MKNGSVGSSLCQLRRNEFEPSLPPPRIPERKRYLGLPRDFLRKWTRVFLRIIITTDSERFELLSPIVDLSITSPGGRMSLARRRFDGIVLISFARGFLIRRVFGAFWRATKKTVSRASVNRRRPTDVIIIIAVEVTIIMLYAYFADRKCTTVGDGPQGINELSSRVVFTEPKLIRYGYNAPTNTATTSPHCTGSVRTNPFFF